MAALTGAGAALASQVVQSARSLPVLRVRHEPLLAAAALAVAGALEEPQWGGLTAPALAGWLQACAVVDWAPEPALALAVAGAVLSADPAAAKAGRARHFPEAVAKVPWSLAVLGLLDAPTLRFAAERFEALLAEPGAGLGDAGGVRRRPLSLYHAARCLRDAHGLQLEQSLPDAALRAAGAEAWRARGDGLTISVVQRSVASALCDLDANLSPRVEHKPEPGMSIVIAVWALDGSGRRAAVEVDGPHHYVTEIGSGAKRFDEHGDRLPPRRRRSGPTRLRNAALEARRWPEVVVNTKDWHALGAAARLEYLRAKLAPVLGPL
jgi:hypothetical protein